MSLRRRGSIKPESEGSFLSTASSSHQYAAYRTQLANVGIHGASMRARKCRYRSSQRGTLIYCTVSLSFSVAQPRLLQPFAELLRPFELTLSIVPAYGLLQGQDAIGENLLSGLFEKSIVLIFEKDFMFADLIVLSGEGDFADLHCDGALITTITARLGLLVQAFECWRDGSIPMDEFVEIVPNGIADATNVDRFHHTGIAKLLNDTLAIEHLPTE